MLPKDPKGVVADPGRSNQLPRIAIESKDDSSSLLGPYSGHIDNRIVNNSNKSNSYNHYADGPDNSGFVSSLALSPRGGRTAEVPFGTGNSIRKNRQMQLQLKMQQKKVQDLLLKPDDEIPKADMERSSMISKLLEQHREEQAFRLEETKQIFTIDQEVVNKSYLLPGKPDAPNSGVLNVYNRKAKMAKSIKSKDNNSTIASPRIDENNDENSNISTVDEMGEQEYSFLSGIYNGNLQPNKRSASPGYDSKFQNKTGHICVDSSSVDKNSNNNSIGGGSVTDSPGKTALETIKIPSENDDITKLLATLQTDNDAINFFARYGSDTPIKSINFVQNSLTEKRFRPYDLVQYTKPDVRREYFAISSAGVLHYVPDEASDCYPLSIWVRHKTIFDILRSVRFFRNYLYLKTFTIWKENVRFQLFVKQRNLVSDNLFLSKKNFVPSILAVKKHLLNVESVNMLHLDLKVMEKDTFLNNQTTALAKASVIFDELLQQIMTSVQNTMTAIKNTYEKANQAYGEDPSHFDEVEDDSNKSLYQMRLDKIEKKRHKLQSKKELNSLNQFLLFIDYMCMEVFVLYTVHWVHMLYEDFAKVRKMGIFEVQVRFVTNGVMFQPTKAEILEVLENIFVSLTTTVGNINRVTFLTKSGGTRNISTASRGNIIKTVKENRTYIQLVEKIQLKIGSDFLKAFEHAQSFEAVRPMYEFNNAWSLERFVNQNHDMTSLKSLMEQIILWNKELEKLRNKSIGILEVDSRRLKGELQPLQDARLKDIKDHVKDLAKIRCAQIIDHYKDCINKLSSKPNVLKDFASYVQVVNTMKEDEKMLFKSSNQIDQMYNLLKIYQVSIPPDDIVAHEDLHDKQAKYRVDVEIAQNYRDGKLGEMNSNIDATISKLQDQVTSLTSKLDDPVFVEPQFFDSAMEALEELSQIGSKLDQISQIASTYVGYQNLFDFPLFQFKELDICREKYECVKTLWECVKNWNGKHEYWMESQFTAINVEDLDKQVQVFFKESFNLHKKISSQVSELLRDKVADFRSMVPNILDLGNPNMRSRHFEKLFKIINQNYYEGMPFTLGLMIRNNIMAFKDFIADTSGQASGEAQLEESLQKITSTWTSIKFTVMNHRDQHNLFILGSLEDIFVQLEDNQVSLQTMLGSRFIRTIQAQVESWATKLASISDTLDEWLACQRTWMYLENIFGAEDIQKQLPAESQRFLIVDRSWKAIMKRTNEDPLVLACLNPLPDGLSLLNTFLMNNESLDAIQKSLEEFLETKRMAFPRFYFLSNDELLEIMSQTRDPHAVQPHMGKCFDAIKRIKFGETKKDAHNIMGFQDPDGEMVPLTAFVKAEGPVETWLLDFEKSMKSTLYDLCKAAYFGYAKDDEGAINRALWLWAYPAQVVIAIDQVWWTQNCALALAKIMGLDDRPSEPHAMEEFLTFSLLQIDAMVNLIRTQLSRHQRTLMCALLTIDVHARDVVRTMVAKQTSALSDFEWTKQLRYYWDMDQDDVFVKQTNSSFRYGYEYLGNGPRLVITPLTDTCYMTLTGALHMRLGGAPAGPAGTGKTETTKDLAKALAVYCVVFNCSDGLDYKIMGRFFSGLAQQGAWSCFDEFNRIDIEVLSVIAQQVLCIQQAIAKGVKSFDFEGKMIPLNMAFGVFITMNPGYAGRTELPDNLKSLFRPVAMMVPDYRLIAEIMLFAEGFANALPLSNKMSQLYALSSEQLSKQSHYDFGMRAVKTVLVAAGQLKRKSADSDEDILLIRAMRDSNIPKFLEHDIPLFQGIISDLFPGINVPYVDYGHLQAAIEKTLELLSLQKVPTFITKCIQVHETQLVRHGMMLVGETSSGKSTNVRVLSQALGTLFESKITDRDGFFRPVDCLILNPKSITAGELYGEFNMMTNEWKDGIVPKLVRDCVNALNEGSINRKWIVFDGPVDAVWIENMNTVLDDNKTLCLANSERIKLPSTLHMMFEVQDLKVASPATVSRCGMVFMEQIHVGMMSLVHTWADIHLQSVAGFETTKKIVSLIEDYLGKCIEFIRLDCKEKVATTNNQITQNLLNIFMAKLNTDIDPIAISQDMNIMGALLLWSFVWSLGANLVDASRPKFSNWIKENFSVAPKFIPLLNAPYDYYLDFSEEEKVIKHWAQAMPSFNYDPSSSYFSILVPTTETTRYRHILNILLNAGHNVLFMAETGVGKSVVINAFLNDMVSEGKCTSYVMGYSAQTKPANLRDVLETKLEKKRKNLLGPPSGKKMFLFIDDLNMPSLETYGAQPPNELLRQLIDQGGFYDVDKLFFKSVKDVIVVSACAPPGGGRNNVSPRLLRHFHMVWLTNLTTESMCRIFTSILSGFLNVSAPQLEGLSQPIVQSSVDIYSRIQKELLPTPLRSHYTFNLRDLSKVFQGMLMVKSKYIDDKSSILKLWCHESARVFRDRLINEEDRSWFNGALLERLQSALGMSWKNEDFADLIYGNYTTRMGREYKELFDRNQINVLLNEYLDEYNMTFPSRMELVFFTDAVYHVSRIARVLSQPRGNALLVGVGGSGRQSLTKMAAFMADYKCRQIEITRGYGINEFHDNLKDILMLAGAKNTPSVFLFSDTQIVTETFLEDINNILNSGEVPNLFDPEEIEKIIGLVRPLAKAAGKVETREAILQHYIYLVRENLHIVLCMSPIGAGFRTRCRMFPSLVNCCTIDWFNAWPEEALYSVAQRIFSAQQELGIADFVNPLSNMCNRMHRIVENETANYFKEVKRYNYTTPTSYLELIKLYVSILKNQQHRVATEEKKYRVGLDKLKETEVIVAKLEIYLTELQPTLTKASVDTEALIVQVTADQKDADAQAAIVEVDVAEANKVAASVKVIKDDCQADLDEAMPAYESAVKALSSLDKKSVQEMKSFNNPPEMVKFTMEAVCILLDVKPDNKGDYWGEAKKLMSQMDFMDKLKDYDKDNMNPKVIKKVMKWYDDPRFQPELVKAQSSAAMALCMWVRAMIIYDRVAKNIEPKKLALKEAESQLAKTMAELDAKKKALQAVLDKVALLQKTLKETQAKKADLEAQADKAKKQLVRAGQLIGGLANEKIRWIESAATLKLALVNLVGDMCLAAGCLAYLGPFTSQFRARILSQWVSVCKDNQLPCGANFSLLSALAIPVTVRQWIMDGLPADDFSCENGLMTTMGRRWPLMIDPQGQANKWIRNMYVTDNLQIIKLTEKDFLRTLENGIRYGSPVLLENVGQELDPSLEPVLLKQVFKKAGQILLRLGDTDVPYSDEFKFMITTKLANPHYMPEVCIKITIINFTVTMKGLEDQLLVDVIKNERPDLESRKDKLVVSIANDQRQLLEIEEEILTLLANASGNILDDEDLINALARSNKTSAAINSRLTEAEVTTKEINDTREGYRVVATRGSIIYFVVANLALVDPMYQYSLQYYKELFVQRLQKTEKKEVLQERLNLLIADITRSIYSNVCRGLFEKDKLLFSFSMAAKISLASGAIAEKDWNTFMVGVVSDEAVLAANPYPVALKNLNITEKSWINAVLIEHELTSFAGFKKDINTASADWSHFLSSENPHAEVIPGDWDTNLTNFQKLLLIRVLREDKVVYAVRKYVSLAIGDFFTESPPFDLEGAFGDSTNVTPLIFILSPGADPTDYLLALAETKDKKIGSGLRIISLGQGQGPIAEKAIDIAQKTGDWVCLQNCHLAVSWLSKLEQTVEKMQNSPGDINQTFRLWLTSMPSTNFPVPVLQNGIKVTTSHPGG
jgi:dynein heavy chain, axonemal